MSKAVHKFPLPLLSLSPTRLNNTKLYLWLLTPRRAPWRRPRGWVAGRGARAAGRVRGARARGRARAAPSLWPPAHGCGSLASRSRISVCGSRPQGPTVAFPKNVFN